MHSYSTDQPNRHKKYLFIGAVGALAIFVAGMVVHPLSSIPVTVGVMGLYWLFSRYLWKTGPVQKLGIAEVPDLNGEWKGHLYTSGPRDQIDDDLIVEEGPEDNGYVKMKATLEIEQTWDEIHMDFIGPESTSTSKAATVLVGEGKWPTLNYNYENPGAPANDELDFHYGTATLQFFENDERLEGAYYTGPGRDRHGKLELYRE